MRAYSLLFSLPLLAFAATLLLQIPPSATREIMPAFTALIFSKTSGFRHTSIPHGIATIRALGAEHGFEVDATEDSGRFTDRELARYKVVIFLNTTGNVLDNAQKAAFETY